MTPPTEPARWLGRFERPVPIRRMGRFFVYRALRDGAPRVVAVSRPELDPADAARLVEQAVEMHAGVEHPAVPRISDSGVEGDVAWLAFACDGLCDLDGLLSQLGDPLPEALPIAATAEILATVADALAALHATGRLAGRLSPAQILLSPTGRLWLIGLGCDFIAHQGPALARQFEGPEYTAMCDRRRRRDPVVDVWLVGALARALVAVEVNRRDMTRLRLGEADADPDALADWRALTARDPALRAPDAAAAGRIVRRLWPVPDAADSALPALVEPLAPLYAADAVGAVIAGRYRLDRRLGFGRRGAWFFAWDTQLEQPVAIKWLDDGGTEAEQARLLREVHLLRSLRHPNVMAGFDVLLSDGRIGAVVEYVPGDPLAEVLRSEVARPHLAASLAGIADALTYLGRRGVVHRDVKPGNIICHEEREAVLVDLGLARAEDDARPVTHPDERLGTWRYMAPEQLTGPGVGPSADVYGFCMVLIDVLVEASMPNHPEPVDALARLRAAGVPEVLARLIAQGVSADPALRPDPQRLAVALRALEPPPGVGTLVMAVDGRWFSIDGRSVDLRRRSALRRILAALGSAHVDQIPLDVGDLQRAGWPDERMQPTSGAARVYTAVSTLRREGLKGVLERIDDGYRLAPSLVIRRVDANTNPPGGMGPVR